MQVTCDYCFHVYDNYDSNMSNICVLLTQDIVKYELLGGTRALEYYYLNPDTGLISLKKPLTEGSHLNDQVSNMADNFRQIAIILPYKSIKYKYITL